MDVDKCALFELPVIRDPRGNLTFVEAERHVPFEFNRIFYLYDVPAGESRGGHAHKTLHQALVCLSGSFDVEVDDGVRKQRFRLDRPSQMLYVPPLIWDTEINFEPGTVCLVLASAAYDEADYYRDYDLFLKAVSQARQLATAAAGD